MFSFIPNAIKHVKRVYDNQRLLTILSHRKISAARQYIICFTYKATLKPSNLLRTIAKKKDLSL